MGKMGWVTRGTLNTNFHGWELTQECAKMMDANLTIHMSTGSPGTVS